LITCTDIDDFGSTFDNINLVAGPGKSNGNGKASKASANNDDMLSFL